MRNMHCRSCIAILVAYSCLAIAMEGTQYIRLDPPSGDAATSDSAFSLLAQMLRADDPVTRKFAIEGLAGSKDPSATRLLLESLADPVPEVRHAAAAAVAMEHRDGHEVLNQVIDLLRGENVELFLAIDEALPNLGESLNEGLLAILDSQTEPEERRLTAAYCLGRTRSHEAVPILAGLAWVKDKKLSYVCARALAQIRAQTALPHLVRLFKHPDAAVRRSAVEGAAILGTSRAMQRVGNAAAGDYGSGLSQHAAWCLGMTNNEAAIPYLIDAMKASRAARPVAATALMKLTGEDFGTRPARWEHWYTLFMERNMDSAEPPQGPRDGTIMVDGMAVQFVDMAAGGRRTGQ